MLFDSHIHIGQFYESYTSPEELVGLAGSLSLNGFAVSSTTMCEENYDIVLGEFKTLAAIGSELEIAPVFWITPALLATDGGVERFLESGVDWRCVKIHPDLTPRFWTEDNGCFDAVVEIADYLGTPVMIHTGGNDYSLCGIWKVRLAAKPDTRFILAHCRPVREAAEMLSAYPNVFGDLSFVGPEGIVGLLDTGLAYKLLWGTDFPIVSRFITDSSPEDYQAGLLATIREHASVEEYRAVTETNFKRLFKI